ncbi:3-phosphoinositide-dependent protein kinase B isoform X1 [Lucilia cuprina]|uniref:3-phosphoinositide-dependent protein kinase B isoform X1 n=2 Tax=Lucilia cuprina TaxID=7375 RepID=UPI001F067150|nr:3-phosphoinositide-dependent protein kinase B isoform X1 [Lucilia cuprina]
MKGLLRWLLKRSPLILFTMLSNLNYLLVTATCFVSICTAIRVDWNTNTGPIIPPTPRTTVRPMPPFREPAPVWEDLSNDIPNPNPYIYVPPPPSRPKQRLNTNINYNLNSNNNYGSLVTPQNANSYYQQNNNSPSVASLSPQYIPNVGTRYVAVVPTTSTTTTKSSFATNKYAQTSSSANALSPDDKTSYKLQGKYNVKTKKYKAYEKVKYVPLNYYSTFKPSNKTTEAPASGNKQLNKQELPAVNIKQQWSSPFISKTTTMNPIKKSTTPSTKSYTKHVYVKDTTVKSKAKFSDSVDKAKKS